MMRLELYRKFHQAVFESGAIQKAQGQSREELLQSWQSFLGSRALGSPRPVWFHAASVGELEALLPVIEGAREQGQAVLVTVFSRSARGALEKLRKEAADSSSGKGELIYAGFAPWEGRWGEWLGHVKPCCFVTAKYEAWPELWASLGEQGIPLTIVGARDRASLRIARRVCAALGAKLPELHFYASTNREVQALERSFPEARVIPTGDPRWDRVFSRSSRGSPRARSLTQALGELRRPWGVLGSVWVQDFRIWQETISQARGTLWVVPHRVDAEEVRNIEGHLREAGIAPLRSSTLSDSRHPGSPRCVLVDEMGFLSELYGSADWAYVGGGFGEGVHSTIEPAIHGIPIAIGPKGAQKFPEIQELEATLQLRRVESSEDLRRWLKEAQIPDSERKEEWVRQAKARLGATERILRSLPLELSARSC